VGEQGIIQDLYGLIVDRREKLPDGSYTSYLFKQGEDVILKKIGEETAEVIIAAKNKDAGGLAGEAADLVYHLLVLLAWRGLGPDDVLDVLAARFRSKQAAGGAGVKAGDER